MERRDQLLRKAEQLARELRPGSGNEVKRALHYYKRHRDYNKMVELLDKPIPQYGSKEIQRWGRLREVLKGGKNALLQYEPDEIALILGWTARLHRR